MAHLHKYRCDRLQVCRTAPDRYALDVLNTVRIATPCKGSGVRVCVSPLMRGFQPLREVHKAQSQDELLQFFGGYGADGDKRTLKIDNSIFSCVQKPFKSAIRSVFVQTFATVTFVAILPYLSEFGCLKTARLLKVYIKTSCHFKTVPVFSTRFQLSHAKYLTLQRFSEPIARYL